ncbi:TonB-dependent receptor [Cytophagaceae bacterium DM2B3-1]|uniref:TonB-dependent receptor n=1 Tax=Xanthocytophaga flava TaxID=3048013 RepID=A0ABT7CSN9_9BACT|nr:TonB-dependent receptor [Xanthocytophaga flavus]MDJ1496748.1 TonB-dependent receptor [Xanthocytophaga flavus]
MNTYKILQRIALYSLLLFIGGIFGNSLQAQENCQLSVSGTVVHSQQQPFPGAVVFIVELKQGTTTDEKGRYHIDHVCPGTYTVICQYVGHHTDSTYIQITKSQGNLNFHLDEMEETLETVVVQGTHQENATLLPQQSLQGKDLERIQGIALGEMVKTLPGLNSIQTGPSISKPVIHGLHSNRVLILNNGIRQEGQQWGSEHAPEIDPFVAKRITIIKGASSVRYGADAIGGVILVEPDPLPQTNKISGEINLHAFSNNRQGTVSGLMEGGLKKINGLGWRVQGTYKKAGTSRTPDYYLTNSQFEEANVSAATGYKTAKYGFDVFFSHFSTKIGIFTGSHIGNQTDLENAINADRPLVSSKFSYNIGRPYQDISHNLAKVNAFYVSPALGKFSLLFGYQYNFRQEYDAPSVRSTNIRFRLYTYTYELLWEHKPLLPNTTGTIGVSTVYQGNNVGGNVYLIPNFNNQGVGGFIIEKWAKNQWQAEAGIRYDYRHLDVYRRKQGSQNVIAPGYTYTSFSGTLGATYQPHQNLSLNLNFSSAWRPPTAAELYSAGVHHGAAAYEKGDSALSIEQSYHTTISLNWKPTDKLSADIGVYANYMPGYIYLKPDSVPIVTIRGAFPAYTYTQTNALFKGLDATLKYQLLPYLSWQGKLAMVRALNRTTDEYLPWIPTDRIENTLRYEKTKWKKLTNIYVAVSVLNVSKQRRVPPTYTTTTTEGGATRTIYVGDFAPPPVGYMLLSADMGFAWPIGKYIADIGVSGQNLANVRYRDYLNRFRYFSDEIGRNIIIRLKFSF